MSGLFIAIEADFISILLYIYKYVFSNTLGLVEQLIKMRCYTFSIILGLLVSASSMAVGNVFAQSEELTLKLESLEMIRQEHKGGDDLIISVLEYTVDESPNHYQIPTFPTHWMSQYLKNVKNVAIWRKRLQHCEPINLIISLKDEHLPPWDISELLGSVQLSVKCVNGQSVEVWSIPDPKITVQDKVNKNAFLFTGENAEYRAVFKIENTFKTKAEADKEKPLEPIEEHNPIIMPFF